MEKKIGIIGHVDHGKTTLTKTIQEIIDEEKSFKITEPPEIPLIEWDFKSGKESRRERRAKERKANKKRK